MKDTLFVDEIFYSIQGEGPNAGTPAIFLRLSKCNLRCSWCDTASPKDFKKYVPINEVEMTFQEVANEINRLYKKNSNTMLVLTGGEPLVQQKSLLEFLNYVFYPIEKLIDEHIEIEIETNGTILPLAEFFEDYNASFNVSPKMENSDNSWNLRHRSKVLRWHSDHDSKFKFVVDEEEDMKEIEIMIGSYYIEAINVYLMPQGVTTSNVLSKGEWLAEICKETGYNLCLRQQILIWGNRRET